jgi:hypothetical protein
MRLIRLFKIGGSRLSLGPIAPTRKANNAQKLVASAIRLMDRAVPNPSWSSWFSHSRAHGPGPCRKDEEFTQSRQGAKKKITGGVVCPLRPSAFL